MLNEMKKISYDAQYLYILEGRIFLNGATIFSHIVEEILTSIMRNLSYYYTLIRWCSC